MQRQNFSSAVQASAERLATFGVSALGALFDLTSERLVRYAISITRNQHDAEDAVQAALVKVATNPRRLADADSPWAFLLCMVRNEALLVLRRRQRRRVVDGILDLLTRRRVDHAEQEEQYRAIWGALRRLPTEQAEVIVLKIWEEMTFAEISEIQSVSLNTAASRYQYGMSKLTQMLGSLKEDFCHE